VHGIMFTVQRSSGPAWYMEGIAELLATHRWKESQITVPYFPAKPTDVPKLGRIEIVQAEAKRGAQKNFADVLALENRHYLKNEPYAWSWAAAAFLYGHPAYRDRFRAIMKQPVHGDLNGQLKGAYAADAQDLAEEWRVFVCELSHGYDFERTRLNLTPARAMVKPDTPVNVVVAADRGWQNTGLRLDGGQGYKLTATGQFTLANEPKPWVSEPGGVTIRYCRGLPLGILLAAIRPDEKQATGSTFCKPEAISQIARIQPQQSGTLFLRVNEFAGELADNRGTIEVTIERSATDK
jgi:hypothetical protein